MSKQIFLIRRISKRTFFFLILTSLVLFVLSLGYFLFVNSDQTNNTYYYKELGRQDTSITTITLKESWSKNVLQDRKALLTKEVIEGNFIARTDNLGTIAIPFDTHNKSINDKVIFRLKETGQKEWYFQSIYNTSQFQNDIPFPFGFPIITNSKDKAYTFQIESLTGKYNNSISLNKTNGYFFSKYQYSKAELINNPSRLVQFLTIKINAQLPSFTPIEGFYALLFALAPFLLYPILRTRSKQLKKLIRTKRALFTITNIKTYLLYLKRVSYNLSYSLKRKDKIKICALIVSAGFFFAVGFHFFQGIYYERGFPVNSFLPNNFFGDFFIVFNQWNWYKFSSFGLNYFPGAYLIVDLLTKLFTAYTAIVIYLFFFITFIFSYTYINVKTDKVIESLQYAFIISLMSYPFLFAFNTANFEIITFISICLFFIFYKKHRTLSALALAYAISMKLFPGVFIILLLLEKRFKDIFLTCVFTVFFTILPLLIFDGGFNNGVGNYINHFSRSMSAYAELMVVSGAGNHYGHSLLNGLFALFTWMFPLLRQIMLPYIIIISISSVVIILYLIFFEKIFWRRVACLVMMMNLFPIVSTDYKLLYVFIPLFLFINYFKKDKYDTLFIILFSLLLIPKDYFYFNGDPYMSSNIVANPLIMSVILLAIILSGLKPLSLFANVIRRRFRILSNLAS
ncbi:MAG: glycosyltransferase family 87 protein [Candidatus Levyibacteriota bacterium]|jgi:hypothetical protein